jgi:hypothetical protein
MNWIIDSSALETRMVGFISVLVPNNLPHKQSAINYLSLANGKVLGDRSHHQRRQLAQRREDSFKSRLESSETHSDMILQQSIATAQIL